MSTPSMYGYVRSGELDSMSTPGGLGRETALRGELERLELRKCMLIRTCSFIKGNIELQSTLPKLSRS